MTDQEQIAKYQLALASLPCPKCLGMGFIGTVAEPEDCPSCSGSRFLLQGVREECSECNGGMLAVEGCGCQGRGWNPSTDPLVYGKAFFKVLPDAKTNVGLVMLLFESQLLFFQEVAKALGVKDA